MRRQIILILAALLAATLLSACAHVKVDPIEIKPIHIVQDINITLKVDHELDQFFAFQEKPPATSQSTTQPAPAATAATTQAAADAGAPAGPQGVTP